MKADLISLKIVFRNAAARKFFWTAAFIFIGWNTAYIGLLRPMGFPDEALTNFIGSAACDFLNFCATKKFSYNFENGHASISNVNKPLVYVSAACNGLQLYVLYVSFIFCLPSARRRMLIFSLVGIATIIFLNLIRISALAWMHYLNSSWAQFSHKFLFQGIVFMSILFLWHLYANKRNEN